MNKTAIKNFAVSARITLIQAVTQKAFEYEVTENGKNDPSQAAVNGQSLTPVEQSQRAQLIAQIQANGFSQTMEEAAYTWFNRFIALRFMEVNNYLPSHTRIFSDEDGNFKPEVLTDAVNLEIDGLDKKLVLELLEQQKNEQLYQYIIITQCNALNEGLPEMFERIGGWTELLFPKNLLREDSVIAHMVKDIPESDWNDQVQIIGWLYQYYITELNELVYDGKMSKDKIPKHLISAATTIYTPHWSVKYMIENSLGRLWTEGHGMPENADWKYYLEETEQKDTVKSELENLRAAYREIQPEQIKIIDPCMGSGHILVYAFDVLIDIYTACGWSERDAAKSILRNNLYGLDIDRRAYQLAYFAVMMKARQYNRRILSAENQPNLANFADVMHVDTSLLSGSLRKFAEQFQFADTYGSLMTVTKPAGLDEAVSAFLPTFGMNTRQLEMMMRVAQILTQKYDVVCTNPPYMGSNRFTPVLAEYVNSKYKEEKSDLSMAMFRHCIDHLVSNNGFVAFITTSSWFFLSSFEKLRNHILPCYQIDSIVDYGTELFDGKVGHNSIVSWVLRKHEPFKPIIAIRLVDYCYARRNEKETEFFNTRNRYTSKQENFSKIQGSPVAYWVSENVFNSFEYGNIGTKMITREGMATADNDRFLRFWYEVKIQKILFNCHNEQESIVSKKRYFPYNKGGDFNKWYGNNDYVVNWENGGIEIKGNKDFKTGRIRSHNYNGEYAFKKGITWSSLSSGNISLRYTDYGFLFDSKGAKGFPKEECDLYYILGLLNSNTAMLYLKFFSPTIDYKVGDVILIPYIKSDKNSLAIDYLVKDSIDISRADWDSFETSWDFEGHPLI